jgi:hypothetical protein
VLRFICLAVALLGIGLLARAQFQRNVESQDASGHYTDHLRHMGEALILADQGLAVYRRPYGELIAAQHLDPIHTGLFVERTAPYPPLGMLAHWPWASADRSGTVSSTTAHRGVVWMWTLVALAACAIVVRLCAPLPPVPQVWAGLIAVPLLVGIGVNGFLDAGYLLCGALACLAWSRQQRVVAIWCLAFAAALHFRAAVFAPMAAVVLWELRSERKNLGRALPSVALVIPSLVAAVALAGTLETIPPHNPVHFTHLKIPLAVFTGLTATVAIFLWTRAERLVAVTVIAAFALAIMERSHGWWHAGTLLAPGMLLAARTQRVGWHWPLLVVWTVGGSYLAYRHPWSVFWTWVPFALGGL